jgi:O-antigen/teichoic acid export membrane protein
MDPGTAPAPDAGTTSGLLRRNTLASLAARVASLLAWVLVTPFVLDRLGLARFGIWSLFFALAGYATVADLGLGSAIPRFLPELLQRGDVAAARRVVRRSLTLAAGVGLVWCLLGWVLRDPFLRLFDVPSIHAAEVRSSLPVMGFSLALLSVAGAMQAALHAEQRLVVSSAIFIVALVLHLATLTIGIAMGWGIQATAWASLAASATQTLAGALAVRHLVRAVAPATGSAGPSWRQMLGFGAVVQATNVAIVSATQLGKVILGAVGSLAQVTLLELGLRLAGGAWSLAALVQAALLPAVAHAWSRGDVAEVRTHYLWASRWGMALGSWLLGGLFAVAPAVLVAWVGPPGAAAAVVVRLLVVAFALLLSMGPAAVTARACGYPALELAAFAAVVPVQITITILAAPAHGAAGAAAGAVAGFAIGAVILLAGLHGRIGLGHGPWLRMTVLPRLLPAVGCAWLGAWWLELWIPVGRGTAFLAIAAIGSTYTLAYLAATWPTGDVIALVRRARGWIAGSSWMARHEGAAP